MGYLEHITSPEDVKAIPKEEIPALCREIREFLVGCVEKQGGHLASNLGVTELTVALHRVFDSPRDHIIFDVGHQAYVHKLLTGRHDRFDTLRTPGGLSGFTSRAESEHDPFGAGHSSTSVSAALGFAEADALSGSDAFSVAVLGDGAYTGGMVHEALNNCKRNLRLIIILNENGMSISRNRGAFSRYLNRVRVSETYRRFKRRTKSFLARIPGIGLPLSHGMSRIRDGLLRLFYPMNYFEELGMYYIGPVDGCDEAAVEAALTRAKNLGECTVVHIRTKKGNGYAPAEQRPDLYHGLTATPGPSASFHTVFADELCRVAAEDPDIVAVTAAMGQGTGLDAFGARFADRYYDVGIAEEHAVTFAAGLAAAGKKPYVVIYSTFLQRAYDSILHDVALQKLPVRLMVDRAGLAVGDGVTHHGIFDVSFLSGIPGIHLYAPITFGSLRAVLAATADEAGAVAIRYPNAGQSAAVMDAFYPTGDYADFGVRADFPVSECPCCVYITYGGQIVRTLEAERRVRAAGISCGTILLEELTPYEAIADRVLPYLQSAERVVFAEEGILAGGAGMNLGEALARRSGGRLPFAYRLVGVRDFVSPPHPCDIYTYLGLDAGSLSAHFLPEES